MAENVTITTFLELKDNMSDGLKKVEEALRRLASGQKSSAASTGKAEEAVARARMKNAAKATEFAARQAQKQKAQAERIAMAELKATQRAQAASVRSAERAERQKANTAIREIRRVEAARLRANKEQARQQKSAAREQEREKRERADFVGKVGAAMFGKGAGGFMAAAMTSKKAALQLGLIGLVDTIASGITNALSKAFDIVKGFFEKVYALNKEYQTSIRRIAGTLVSMNFVPTFQIATSQAEKLYNTMRDLAAKLPGETKDFMEVFSMALPQAIHAGEQDLKKFTEKVSKFTAYAMFRNVKDINQVASDMSRMIMGKAIGPTRMFKEYLAYFQMATKQVKFGVREFNEMSMPERLELMYKAIDKSAETFGYMVNDADTLEGTFNSLVDQILTVGGKPLFEAALSSLKLMNKMLSDNNSKLTEMVKRISVDLGDALRGAVALLAGYGDGIDKINSKTLELHGVTGLLFDVVVDIVSAFEKAFGYIKKIGETKRMAEREARLDEERQKRKEMESSPEYAKAKAAFPADAYFPGGKVTVQPERPAPTVTVIPGRPAATGFDRFMAKTLGGYAELVGEKGVAAAQRAKLTGTPATTKVEQGWSPEARATPVPLTSSLYSKQQMFEFTRNAFRTADKDAATLAAQQRGVPEDVINKAFQAVFRSPEMTGMGEGGGGKHKARGVPKGRQTTVNDFRFSKFDIRQEFAEGFDPDRIAVAFASDLSKLGEMRMQSAYAPLYSSRY